MDSRLYRFHTGGRQAYRDLLLIDPCMETSPEFLENGGSITMDTKDLQIPLLGYPLFDEEHQVIINLLRSIHDKVREDWRTVARQLLDYATGHCSREERQMEIDEYPNLEEHKAAHRELQDTILKELHLLDPGIEHHSEGVLSCYRAFVRQIVENDAKYANWLRDRDHLGQHRQC
jgi:hemerythrin-like metal-binding protein